MRVLTLSLMTVFAFASVGCSHFLSTSNYRDLQTGSKSAHYADCTGNPVGVDCVQHDDVVTNGPVGYGYGYGMGPMYTPATQSAILYTPGYGPPLPSPVAPPPASTASASAGSDSKLPVATAKLAVGASKEARKAKELACKSLAEQGKSDPACAEKK